MFLYKAPVALEVKFIQEIICNKYILLLENTFHENNLNCDYNLLKDKNQVIALFYDQP